MYSANGEPTVAQLLTDPIARLLMKRDGLRPAGVRAYLIAAKRRLVELRRLEREAAEIADVCRLERRAADTR